MSLSYGNKLFRERKGKEALVYESLLESINSNSILAETINLNIQLVKNSLNETDSDLNHDFANISAKESFGSANIAFKLFDKDFYEKSLYEQNIKHTCKSKLDYFNHFLEYGEAKGFQPNPAFSSIEYKSCNSDLFPGESPSGCYKHFISSGAVEKRRYWRKATSQHHNEFFRFKVIESHLIDWNELKQRAFQSDLVSIIIPVFGEPNLLEKCVESIYASQSSLKYEVVLVDNKKDRETTNVINTISEKYQNITIQSNLFNYNFALGCNSGLLQAKGSHLIFLNTDTVVEDYWIDKLIRPLNNPFIRAVQPKLVYSKNKIQSIGTALSSWSYMPFELYKNEPATARHVSYSRPFNIVTAACIAVRTTDFVRVNGFNTQYINGCEDIDLCLKLIENYKYQCWYESSVTIRHYESKSSGRGMWNEVNRIFFVKNWMHDLKPDLNQYLDQDGISVDLVVDSRKRQSRRIHSCYPEKYFHNSSKISKDSPLLTSITSYSDISENQSDICISSSQVSSK